MAGLNRKQQAAVAFCDEHQKQMYSNRKRARRVAALHPEHKRSYRCDAHPGMWHIGGLPDAVRHGEMTKEEFYAEHERRLRRRKTA